jgi:hypothetical protein
MPYERYFENCSFRRVAHEEEQVLDGEDGGTLVYNPADQPEDRTTIAVQVLVQEVEVREEAEMYYDQDATCLSSEPLRDIQVC